MHPISNALLYLLTPPNIVDTSVLIPMVVQVIRAGADVIQFRNKLLTISDKRLIEIGKRLCNVVHKEGAIFIMNDRVDIAVSINADGVHLGQDDMPTLSARRILGRKRMLIGRSTHSVEQAIQAQSEGADYIGFGPIFPTTTKTGQQAIGIESFKILNSKLTIPYFAIGGICTENIVNVLDKGASRVAVCNGVFGERDMTCRARILKTKLLSKDKRGI